MEENTRERTYSNVEIEQEDVNNGTPYATIEKKLGELLLRGWTMLPESCSLESCGCPLMKSFDGNRYCVGCESWVFEKERKKKEFKDIVTYKPKDISTKGHTEIQNVPKKVDFNYTFNQGITSILQMKLVYLTNLLNKESNLTKIKELLEIIQSCMQTLQTAKTLAEN